LAAVQVLPEQQRSPDRPQATHSSLLQTVLPAVQRLLEQQGSPRPPQRVPPSMPPPSEEPDTHAPAEHVRDAALPELAHAAPARTQVVAPVDEEVQQQPPLLHRLPEQQVSPAAPQARQVPAFVPVWSHSASPVQVSFSQQGSPTAPQGWQVSGPVGESAQAVPAAAQVRPAQQGCPVPPHKTQLPLKQTLPGELHVSRAQQISPTAPHAMHSPLLQTVPAAAQASPGQHAWPTPPQT
jgi:hypothetical protein